MSRSPIEDWKEIGALRARVALLEAELKLLSDKACAAVVGYREALGTLTDSFKYSTEVVTIARNALAASQAETIADPPIEYVRCLNWPCVLPHRHIGPCTTSKIKGDE